MQCSKPLMYACMPQQCCHAGCLKDGLLQDASPPEGELASAIDKDFGSLQNLQTKLSGMCAADKLQVRPCQGCVASTTSLILLWRQLLINSDRGHACLACTKGRLLACFAAWDLPHLTGLHPCGPDPALAPCKAVHDIGDLVQGSGWGWLGYNKDAGRLMLTTTANQDPAATQVGWLDPAACHESEAALHESGLLLRWMQMGWHK